MTHIDTPVEAPTSAALLVLLLLPADPPGTADDFSPAGQADGQAG